MQNNLKINSESDGTKYQFIGNTGNENIQQHKGEETSEIHNVGKSTERKTKFLQQINHKAKSKVREGTYRIRLKKSFNQI